LKQYFVTLISRFVAGQRPPPSSRGVALRVTTKESNMRVLENVAMAAVLFGAQSLAIATILIR
jgi:hypothetical protein